MDLLRYYQVDVGVALETGYPTTKMLLALIEHLPVESAFKSRVVEGRGPAWEGWGLREDLLAQVVDEVRSNTLYTGQWKKRPKPWHFPRPDEWEEPVEVSEERSEPVKVSLFEMASRIQKMATANGGD